MSADRLDPTRIVTARHMKSRPDSPKVISRETEAPYKFHFSLILSFKISGFETYPSHKMQ